MLESSLSYLMYIRIFQNWRRHCIALLPLYFGSGVKVVVTSDDVDPEPASGRVSVVTVPSGRLLRKHNPLSDLQTLYHHLYKQHPICWGPDTLQNGFNLLVMSVSVIGSGVSLGLSTTYLTSPCAGQLCGYRYHQSQTPN